MTHNALLIPPQVKEIIIGNPGAGVQISHVFVAENPNSAIEILGVTFKYATNATAGVRGITLQLQNSFNEAIAETVSTLGHAPSKTVVYSYFLKAFTGTFSPRVTDKQENFEIKPNTFVIPGDRILTFVANKNAADAFTEIKINTREWSLPE